MTGLTVQIVAVVDYHGGRWLLLCLHDAKSLVRVS